MTANATRVFAFIGVLLCATSASADGTRTWNFRVYLDEAPIGEHRFVVRDRGAAREVESHARFDVRVLGLSVYRYAHDAAEHWRGECIEALTATTDDNGERTEVLARRESANLRVVATGRSEQQLPGCVMTFAYWNPRLTSQRRLLNAQTGQYEAIRVGALSEATIVVSGMELMATRFRLVGAAQPIELWYSPQREWVGLDSTVKGGRVLRYRLAT